MAEENPKPLSLGYQAMKAILRNISFETREDLEEHAPYLRGLNSLVPYKFDYLHMRDIGLVQTDRKIWEFEQEILSHTFHEDIFEGRRRETTVIVYDEGETEYEAMTNKYIKNGTLIHRLKYADLPTWLEEKDPDSMKLRVSELNLYCEYSDMTMERIHKLSQFVDHTFPLKRVRVDLVPAIFPIFEDPLIQSCTRLSLGKYKDDEVLLRLEDLLEHGPMNNTHLELVYPVESPNIRPDEPAIEFVLDLAKHWIKNGKPMGSSFTSPNDEYMFICDSLLGLKDNLNARQSKIAQLGFSFFANCMILPLSEKSEIVAYGIRYKGIYHGETFPYALKMEVKPIGSTKSAKFFIKS